MLDARPRPAPARDEPRRALRGGRRPPRLDEARRRRGRRGCDGRRARLAAARRARCHRLSSSAPATREATERCSTGCHRRAADDAVLAAPVSARLGSRPHRLLRGALAAGTASGTTACTTTLRRLRHAAPSEARCRSFLRRSRAPRCRRTRAACSRGYRSWTSTSSAWSSSTSCSTARRWRRRWSLAGCRPRRSHRSRRAATSWSKPGRSRWVDRPWAYDNERPAHEVELPSFWIDRALVTNTRVRRVHPEPRRCHASPHAPVVARLLRRGGGVRALGRQTAADRGRVGEGREGRAQLEHAPAPSGSGRRHLSTAIPASARFPYREYSEVFFGDEYRVLRGGSWVDRPARGAAELPQLGLPAAPADLLRPPLCARCLTRPPSACTRRLRLSEPTAAAVWLYDERGSRLYEEVTRLPEYYLPRREREILRAHSADIAEHRRAHARSSSAPATPGTRGSCSTRSRARSSASSRST